MRILTTCRFAEYLYTLCAWFCSRWLFSPTAAMRESKTFLNITWNDIQITLHGGLKLSRASPSHLIMKLFCVTAEHHSNLPPKPSRRQGKMSNEVALQPPSSPVSLYDSIETARLSRLQLLVAAGIYIGKFTHYPHEDSPSDRKHRCSPGKRRGHVDCCRLQLYRLGLSRSLKRGMAACVI